RAGFVRDDKHVWALTVGGDGSVSSTDVTGNLGNITGGFQSAEVANINGQLVVLVGSRDGVSRLGVADLSGLTSNPGTSAPWTRFGVGLPNVQVTDLEFDTVDNV